MNLTLHPARLYATGLRKTFTSSFDGNLFPILVTTSPRVDLYHRAAVPQTDIFDYDRKSLLLHNLCQETGVIGEGITLDSCPFFVLKSHLDVDDRQGSQRVDIILAPSLFSSRITFYRFSSQPISTYLLFSFYIVQNG